MTRIFLKADNINYDQALVKAKEKVEKLKQSEKWPEDMWFSIADNWDLNVFGYIYGGPGAALYPVVNRRTDTSVIYPVM